MGVIGYILIFTKLDLKLDRWSAIKFKALERYDARISKAYTRYDALRVKHENAVQEFSEISKIVQQSKQKMDLAFLQWRDIVNRKKDYVEDFKSRGISLDVQTDLPDTINN